MLRALTFLSLASCLSLASAEIASKKPNILFILTDDQGYGDLSAHGNPVLKTPNLDKLLSESVRFTDFMVSPTCAPTRSAIQTGRHEFRNGITHTILERERMDPKAVTIAQVLKGAGYTNGIFGKWHLGDEKAYRPSQRGFDEQFIHGGGGIGQSYPGSCGDAPDNKYFNPVILHNDRFEKTEGYCTDVFFAQATKWMDSVKGKQPFYCHIATNAPHGPYIARPEDKKLYEGKNLGADTENFFGMLHNIDENVGKLMAKLDEWGIAKNTLVIFMNDNGGTAGVRVFNAGMHGSKGSPWIGGTRAMSFWRWPGTLTPADCGALTAHVDVFRTWAALAGATLTPEAEKQVEGRSLVPLLEKPDSTWEDRTLFSHVGRWAKGTDYNLAKTRNASVRTTQYHLVSEAGGGQGKAKGKKAAAAPAAPADAPGWQLFDVKTDPAEAKNIAADKPEVVKSMLASYDTFWNSLPGQIDLNEKAVGPKLNPFAEEYWAQFGGGPSEEDLKRMDPQAAFSFEAKRAGKKQE
ncbi:arylsulfatase [Brevifollis gellanilyticus]|uniref:Arylsulfatase n=1 Tax=Brevifollis gellanilyticus TaxID=748831 RepID=A0A512MAR2_9BACT|nr:arylsulfatase [Brevifollis gellanilyticus]GEP43813.1 arylsulfatase [Brevifollis gellanilyticus]